MTSINQKSIAQLRGKNLNDLIPNQATHLQSEVRKTKYPGVNVTEATLIKTFEVPRVRVGPLELPAGLWTLEDHRNSTDRSLSDVQTLSMELSSQSRIVLHAFPDSSGDMKVKSASISTSSETADIKKQEALSSLVGKQITDIIPHGAELFSQSERSFPRAAGDGSFTWSEDVKTYVAKNPHVEGQPLSFFEVKAKRQCGQGLDFVVQEDLNIVRVGQLNGSDTITVSTSWDSSSESFRVSAVAVNHLVQTNIPLFL